MYVVIVFYKLKLLKKKQLEKLTAISSEAFTVSLLWKLRAENLHAFRIPNSITPHAFRIPVQETLLPSEFQDAALGVGMDIFWSHPFLQMNK